MVKEKIDEIKTDEEFEKELREKIELNKRLTEGYVHRSGIRVKATFNENGDDVTECWIRILREKLRD